MGAGIAGYELVASARAFDPIPEGIEDKVAVLEADTLELGEEEQGVLEVVLAVTLVQPLNPKPKCPLGP